MPLIGEAASAGVGVGVGVGDSVRRSNLTLRCEPYDFVTAASRFCIADTSKVRGTVLCLHGWLDNADSFKGLAPLMAKEGYDVLSLDLPGHGLSDHTGAYSHAQVARSVHSFVLAWQRQPVSHPGPLFAVAHSWGAQCLFYLIGSQPNLFRKVVFLDQCGPPTLRKGLGSPALREDFSPEFFRRATSATMIERKPRRFDSREAAVLFRMRHEGKFKISDESVRSIVETRGIRRVSSATGVHFEYTHDPRLATDAGMFSGFPPDSRNKELAALIETPSLFLRFAEWKDRCTFPYMEAWGTKGGGKLRIMDLDGGHFEFVERPDKIAAAALAYFAGSAGDGGKSRL